MKDDSTSWGAMMTLLLPHCSGELIALLDDDDWWAPDRLERVVEFWRRHPETLYYKNGVIEVHESDKGIRFKANDEWILEYPWHNNSSIVVRKTMLRENARYIRSLEMAYDAFCFFLACSLSPEKVALDPSPLTYWRVPVERIGRHRRHMRDMDSIRRMVLSLNSSNAMKRFSMFEGSMYGRELRERIANRESTPRELRYLLPYIRYRVGCGHFEIKRWLWMAMKLIFPGSRAR